MAESEKTQETPDRKIRLLLHAVDGLVPYLTPRLLRTCFSVEQTDDRLWIGMAVKDTCCVPSFPSDANDPNNNKSHPRGYEFTSDPVVDAWMTAYTRVTVPTFDMAEDARGRQHAKDVDVVATDQHVMLWTGNGRQRLTSDQYARCARGLGSHYTVPFFDGGLVSTTKNKRRLAALRRTRDWIAQYTASDNCGRNTLYPVLVDNATAKTGVDEQLQHVREEHKKACKGGNAGTVLVGWSYLSQELQESSLERARLCFSSEAMLGVLSTKSFPQLLVAACHGASLIGSNLPQRWALEKRAFLCDLEKLMNGSDTTERPPKKPKTTESQSSMGEQFDGNFCLDLHPPNVGGADDHPWYRDKRPLMSDCTCHTCRTHCRAYLYHLVCAKEMLAEVLLFIHNLHHLLGVIRGLELAQGDPEKRESVLAYVRSTAD